MGVGSLPSAKDHTQFLRRREICVRRGGNVLENRRGGDGREGNGWGVKRKEEDWCGGLPSANDLIQVTYSHCLRGMGVICGEGRECA